MRRSACLLALGRPAGRDVGGLSGAGAVSLTSIGDINEREQPRKPATTFGSYTDGRLELRRTDIELLMRCSHAVAADGSDGNDGGTLQPGTVAAACHRTGLPACPHLRMGAGSYSLPPYGHPVVAKCVDTTAR